MNDKPFSPACERNREPILAVLQQAFAGRREALEIGSGSGQHAVHFAANLPWLCWQSSDRAENLPGIRAWLDEAALANTPAPLLLDVAAGDWPRGPFDALFSANTLHIMSWAEVEQMFAGIGRCASADAVLAIYGPFNIEGKFTSASNAAFDASLRAAVPHRGIRDRADVDALALAQGFHRQADHELPANNRCLIWQRRG